MDIISQELDRIDCVRAAAWNFVKQGKWKQVERELDTIRDSFCVLESEQVVRLLEAEMLSRQGFAIEAAQHIKQHFFYLWGSAEALIVHNRIHKNVDEFSKQFTISIRGGTRYSGFAGAYVITFIVLAASEKLALQYIVALGLYDADATLDVERVRVANIEAEGFCQEGVIECGYLEDALEWTDSEKPKVIN